MNNQPNEFQENIDTFLEKRNANARFASFDYCYSYFYSFYRNGNIQDIASPANIESSCFKLGYYLASWGMYRGSSFLLQRSAREFIKVIEYISKLDSSYWEIDVDSYNDETITKLLKLKKDIKNCFQPNPAIDDRTADASDTLVTKIMLGVFWNIPAFDQYFWVGTQLKTVNKTSLEAIQNIYRENTALIIENSNSIKVLDFQSGEPTDVSYTKAKIIDMYGFSKGYKIQEWKKKKRSTP